VLIAAGAPSNCQGYVYSCQLLCLHLYLELFMHQQLQSVFPLGQTGCWSCNFLAHPPTRSGQLQPVACVSVTCSNCAFTWTQPVHCLHNIKS